MKRLPKTFNAICIQTAMPQNQQHIQHPMMFITPLKVYKFQHLSAQYQKCHLHTRRYYDHSLHTRRYYADSTDRSEHWVFVDNAGQKHKMHMGQIHKWFKIIDDR